MCCVTWPVGAPSASLGAAGPCPAGAAPRDWKSTRRWRSAGGLSERWGQADQDTPLALYSFCFCFYKRKGGLSVEQPHAT